MVARNAVVPRAYYSALLYRIHNGWLRIESAGSWAAGPRAFETMQDLLQHLLEAALATDVVGRTDFGFDPHDTPRWRQSGEQWRRHQTVRRLLRITWGRDVIPQLVEAAECFVINPC